MNTLQRQPFVGLVALAAVLFALGGCSLFDSEPTRDSTGAIVEEDEVEALELRVGDCFNEPSSIGDTVSSVMVVPCADLHDLEIYHSFELADGAYPGEEAIEEAWLAGCLARFESFIGVPFDESILEISGIFPTVETWTEIDDREVLCAVTAVSGEPRTDSAEGSGV